MEKEKTLMEFLSENPKAYITRAEMVSIINGITTAYDAQLQEAYASIIGLTTSLELVTQTLVKQGLVTKEELIEKGESLIKKDIAKVMEGIK